MEDGRQEYRIQNTEYRIENTENYFALQDHLKISHNCQIKY